MGQRITGMTSGQKSLPVVASSFKFAQHGQSGAWVSELLPHTAKVVDDLAVIKTVTPRPSITIRRSPISKPEASSRPAKHGCLGKLRPRQ